jgi:hypothetical protein
VANRLVRQVRNHLLGLIGRRDDSDPMESAAGEPTLLNQHRPYHGFLFGSKPPDDLIGWSVEGGVFKGCSFRQQNGRPMYVAICEPVVLDCRCITRNQSDSDSLSGELGRHEGIIHKRDKRDRPHRQIAHTFVLWKSR